MDEEFLAKIRKWKDQNAKILFGRGHAGQCKIKVKHGPGGIFTSRYNVDPETFEAAKRIMSSRSDKQ